VRVGPELLDLGTSTVELHGDEVEHGRGHRRDETVEALALSFSSKLDRFEPVSPGAPERLLGADLPAGRASQMVLH